MVEGYEESDMILFFKKNFASAAHEIYKFSSYQTLKVALSY